MNHCNAIRFGVRLLVPILLAIAFLEPSAPAQVLPPGCEDLQVPAGNEFAFRTYAVGYQIYRWNGSAWNFVAPSADLFADANVNGHFGTHSAGPIWESNSGSWVRGMSIRNCTPEPAAIPWLLLWATASNGPGPFRGITYIQRLNTVGGLAPTAPGTMVGQEMGVFYKAEYWFYRAAE